MTTYFNTSSQKEKRRLLREKQTNSERIIWAQLRSRRFQGIKFRRQYSVDSYVLDFYSPERMLAIEIDGEIHRSREHIQNDKLRQDQIECLGIKFLRFSSEEVENNLNNILEQIATFCNSNNL